MNAKKAIEILAVLDTMYPDAKCELNFNTPFELLVAVILSAQCTDKRVNIVTEKLFKKYSTPFDFADLAPEALEKQIYTCGFYKNKAKNIISASQKIIQDFKGEVPRTVEELTTLDGVGRKTANVLISVAFNGQALAVDTHVFRVSHRLAMSDAKDADKTEYQLTELIPPELWYKAHHLMIFHGRYTCHALKPQCQECKVKNYCSYIKGES